MVRKYLWSVGFIFLILLAFKTSLLAQPSPNENPQVGTQAKGNYFKVVVLDSLTKEPIEFATISAKYIGETQAKKYALTDIKGVAILQGVRPGRATISFEYMGYKVKSFTYDIVRGANEFGQLLVQESANLLNAVVVTDVANPMTVKKDTIEYNASSYKINDTDMLEELLKKLPGVEIDSDGKITANGKQINKIMIDGKTFFLDDPQLATKNLPAKIINKVRVVERKSDQSQFTGIDDGQEETVIDLNIRPGMMNGWFGNVMAGYGTEDRFQAAAMIGRFTDKSSVSIIGNGNNTNNRGFSDMAGSMRSGMGGGRGMFGFSGNGITTSWMGGVNANTEVLGGKMKLSGHYMYTGSEKDVEEKKTKQTMLTEVDNMFNSEEGNDNTKTNGHRIGGEIDYKISDNTSILFRPRVNIGSGSFDSYNKFSTLRNADSTNRGYNNSWGDNDSQSINGELLLRQRLGKPGRTMSVRFEYGYSNNEIVGFNDSETYYFDNDSLSVINQKYNQREKSNSIGGRFSYTEPLGKNFFIEAAYRFNYKQTNSDKETWDADVQGDYNKLDSAYTSHYENTFITQQAELNFMKQEEKYNLTIGVGLQPSTTKSLGRIKDTTYSVLNFAPSARFDYRFTDSKFLRIHYRGRTSQPSISQLLPVPDNSNPLQITIGNDKLNPEFSHNFSAEYRANNKGTFSWFSASINASYTSDKIVGKKYYTPDGVQVSTYENTDKPIYSTSGMVMYNSKIAKSNFSITSFTSIRYGNGVSYVRDGKDFAENITKNFSATENLRFTYRNNFIEVIAGGKAGYQNAWYTVSSMDKVSTWTNAVTGSVNATIPGGFNVTSDIEHTFYFGFDAGYGSPTTVWNAELSKTLFKSSATIKVKIYDILKQARNTYRTTSENYIQDVQNNTLGQYVMFSLVYRFGKFSGNMGKMGPRGGMRGGFRH
ncbi:MAG: outer membrane beta-barrel protein [Bacteroidales bacterium]